MLRFTLAVLTAAAVVEPGTAQQKSAPYLAASRSRRSNNGGYGAISPKRSHPLWEVLRSAKLYDDQQRPWDFFRDMDQANGYRHDNVFDNIDLDGNKELEHSEFMWAFTSKGHTNQAGQIMWDRDDKDKDGIITFVEFDGFKGIGDSNNLIEYPEFHSFMRRNRYAACSVVVYLALFVSHPVFLFLKSAETVSSTSCLPQCVTYSQTKASKNCGIGTPRPATALSRGIYLKDLKSQSLNMPSYRDTKLEKAS